MRLYVYISTLCLALSACGGGGSAGTATPGNKNEVISAASVTAKPLADNKVELSLVGTGLASRFCIRPTSSGTPLASDACFSDADSLLKVQQKTLTPSATQQNSFTAWLLTGSAVTRHSEVNLPGKTCSQAAYAASNASALPTVCIITDEGDSVLALEPVKAPITVANFLRYVNQGYYDQTVFHRFLKGGTNVVQGGEFNFSNGTYQSKLENLSTKDRESSEIPLEFTLDNTRNNKAGSIAMARTNDPDSASTGFFVNTTDNRGPFDSTSSRNGYAVFGNFIYNQESWTNLLSKVPGGPEVVKPNTPIALQWAYQIK